MPSGAKKRKAAKKKQEQASSTLKPNNHGSTEEVTVRIAKEPELNTDERIEITDSSHDHDKSSSSSGSGSSSSDDESQELKRKDGGDKEETEAVTVPSQPVPVAGDAPFIGSTANVIVENTGLMDSTTHSDLNTENIIEISSVDAVLSNEPVETSLPKPNEPSDESKQAPSSTTESDKKESEVVISHEEEAPVQRTSWLSCCGLFDVMTGSSR